jgi:hypothetical protein
VPEVNFVLRRRQLVIDKPLAVKKAVTALIGIFFEMIKLAPAKKKINEKYGQVWSQIEFEKEFEIIKFSEPYVYVKSKSGVIGIMTYQPFPRYYFNFIQI